MTTGNEGAITPPSLWLALTEVPRSLLALGALPIAASALAKAPRGDGHAVLVLPGFLTSDAATVVLRAYLKRLGYASYGWGLGRNLGHRAVGRDGEKLRTRFDEIYARSGRRVSLIGWSLGGVMARQLARERPDAVRQVIALGSPFGGNPAATTLRRTYQRVTGESLSDPLVKARWQLGAGAMPVPMTAIYTRGDGIVAWRNCVEADAPQTENIEVAGSHCGLPVNAAALIALADRLAQPEGQWRAFSPVPYPARLYPASA